MADSAIKSPSGLCVFGFSSLVLSHLGKLMNYDNSFQCSPNSHMYTVYSKEFYLFRKK